MRGASQLLGPKSQAPEHGGALGRAARMLVDRLLALMGWISAILLFVMMFLTFADVVGRYLFAAPIFGASEMIQFLLATSIFAGLSLVNADDAHVTVELFDDAVRQRFPRLHYVLVQGVSVVVMAIIVWQMTRIAIHSYGLGASTIVLEWPLWIAAGCIAFFAVISFVVQLLNLFLSCPVPHSAMDELP